MTKNIFQLFVFVFLGVTFLAGCGEKDNQALVGKWECTSTIVQCDDGTCTPHPTSNPRIKHIKFKSNGSAKVEMISWDYVKNEEMRYEEYSYRYNVSNDTIYMTGHEFQHGNMALILQIQSLSDNVLVVQNKKCSLTSPEGSWSTYTITFCRQ